MATEDPMVSALSQDRGLPLGNSLDRFGRRSLHVKIGNSDLEAIPVIVVDGTYGTFHEDLAATTTTPGVLQTLISGLVPALTTRNLEKVIVILRQESAWTLKVGATVIASGRTGAAHPESVFPWSSPRPLPTGTAYTLELIARSGSIASDVEAYILSSDVT